MTLARIGSGFAVLALSASTAFAQSPTAAPAVVDTMPSWGSLFGDLPRDLRRLPSRANAVWLGGAGAMAFGLRKEDVTLTRRAVASGSLDTTLEAGAFVGGGLVQVGGALGMFAVGRWSGRPRVASAGADLVRAQMINAAITQGLKVAAGRLRPDGGRFSLPSGHASSSFATATVLQRRFGWKIGAPAYAMATYVAASRLQENKHYLSDVILGAAIGIVSGRSVTVGHGQHTFALVPVTGPGSIGIGLTRIGARQP